LENQLFRFGSDEAGRAASKEDSRIDEILVESGYCSESAEDAPDEVVNMDPSDV
jgi:hypothetical protein